MTFWIFSAKIDLKLKKKEKKKAHASLDFSKSSDEKQFSKLEGPNPTYTYFAQKQKKYLFFIILSQLSKTYYVSKSEMKQVWNKLLNPHQ